MSFSRIPLLLIPTAIFKSLNAACSHISGTHGTCNGPGTSMAKESHVYEDALPDCSSTEHGNQEPARSLLTKDQMLRCFLRVFLFSGVLGATYVHEDAAPNLRSTCRLWLPSVFTWIKVLGPEFLSLVAVAGSAGRGAGTTLTRRLNPCTAVSSPCLMAVINNSNSRSQASWLHIDSKPLTSYRLQSEPLSSR